MRAVLIFAMFGISLAASAAADYEEVRELNLDTRGIDSLAIEAGAGTLDVSGVDGLGEIRVTATIQVPDEDAEDARERIESDMVLTLDRDSDVAKLVANFESGFFGWNDSPRINLDVEIPQGMHLIIDDGSGSMRVTGVKGDLNVTDGSGSSRFVDVGGTVKIDDGSGSITVDGAGGDVHIDDGSGSISVSDVSGSVFVDDGSGGINVSNVEADLIITSDGSGGVDYRNIGGRVEEDS